VRVDGLKKRDAFRERGLGPGPNVGGEETYGQQGQGKPAGRAHGGVRTINRKTAEGETANFRQSTPMKEF
jgi:hypothetical protein